MNKILLSVTIIIALVILVGAGVLLYKNYNNLDNEQATEPTATSTQETKSSTNSTPTQTALTADFTPPTGLAEGAAKETPGARRIMSAYSSDGINWTKTNQIVADQADVGDLIVNDDGLIYMYYAGWTLGSKSNISAVALSEDNGQTWIHKYLTFTGFPGRGDATDLDIYYDNGLFRLYGTSHDESTGKLKIVYGESSDGFAFTYKTVAYAPDGESAGASTTYKIGDTFHMMALATLDSTTSIAAGTHWHTTSTNGKTFTLVDSPKFTINNRPYFAGNVVKIGSETHFLAFTPDGSPIRSYSTEDGTTWTLESTEVLTLDESGGLESEYVGEPDIALLADGRYLMIYSTLIPKD